MKAVVLKQGQSPHTGAPSSQRMLQLHHQMGRKLDADLSKNLVPLAEIRFMDLMGNSIYTSEGTKCEGLQSFGWDRYTGWFKKNSLVRASNSFEQTRNIKSLQSHKTISRTNEQR